MPISLGKLEKRVKAIADKYSIPASALLQTWVAQAIERDFGQIEVPVDGPAPPKMQDPELLKLASAILETYKTKGIIYKWGGADMAALRGLISFSQENNINITESFSRFLKTDDPWIVKSGYMFPIFARRIHQYTKDPSLFPNRPKWT